MVDQDNGTYALDRADSQFLGRASTEMGTGVSLAALPQPGTVDPALAPATAETAVQTTLKAALDRLGSVIEGEGAKAVSDLEGFAQQFVGGVATGSGTATASSNVPMTTVDAFVAAVSMIVGLFDRTAAATARIRAGHG